jgi:uncharacterized membrane protein
MEIHERLKLKSGLMAFGLIMIPVSSVLWLHSSTPLNHTFRVTAILFAYLAVLLLYFASFKLGAAPRGG